MRIPRRKKKQIRNCKVILDIISIPKFMSAVEWMDIFYNTGIIIWDSSKGGDAPRIVGVKTKLKIRDENNNNKGRKSGSRM